MAPNTAALGKLPRSAGGVAKRAFEVVEVGALGLGSLILASILYA